MDPLLGGGVITSTIVSALLSLGCEKGVESALKSAAKRSLSLGRLDPNHDIARAARAAQLNTGVFLLSQARENEPKDQFINGGFHLSAAISKPYESAIKQLRHLAKKIEATEAHEIDARLPSGGYASVEAALQTSLSAESARDGSEHSQLQRLAQETLEEILMLGGWDTVPEKLAVAFKQFEPTFAASIAALLKSPSYDSFFRIWMALKAEATNANLEVLLQRISQEKIDPVQRGADAILIAGGEEHLENFERTWSDIESALSNIDQTTKETLLKLTSIETNLVDRNDSILAEALKNVNKYKTARNAGVFALLLMFAAGVFYWDSKVREKSTYCTDVTTRYGVPECVNLISANAISSYSTVYRLTQKGGMPRELLFMTGGRSPREISSSFYVEDWIQGAARRTYEYNSREQLVGENQYSLNGRLLRSINYSFSNDSREAIAVFSRNLGTVDLRTSGASSLSAARRPETSNKARIGQHRLRFDATGLVLERTYEFLGGEGQARDASGAYGRRYEYNFRGQPIRVRNLDSLGNSLVGPSGIESLNIEYSEDGFVKQYVWRDIDGQPKLNERSFAMFRITYDRDLNKITYEYLDENGAPTPDAQSRQSKIVYYNDRAWNLIRREGFDLLGELSPDAKTGAAAVEFEYNDKGEWISSTFFDASGDLVRNKETGAARRIVERDKNGNHTASVFFDELGEPTLSKERGFHRIQFEYDENQNIIRTDVFGIDGTRVFDKANGASVIVDTFDQVGNRTKRSYLGVDLKPVANKTEGAAAVQFSYRQGNIESETYLGVNGEPVLDKETGASQRVFEYDASGNMRKISLFNEMGAPTSSKENGAAIIEIDFDAFGNEVGAAYFGVQGEPVLHKKEGWHRSEAQYDSRGNIIQRSFFDTFGSPVKHSERHVSVLKIELDRQGNVTSEAFFGEDGEPVRDRVTGAHMIRNEFDDLGHETLTSYHAANGSLLERRDANIAYIKFQNNRFGNFEKLEFFGSADRPTKHAVWGVASVEASYDENGNQTGLKFFDENGLPIIHRINLSSEIIFAYDDRGNEIGQKFYGVDGQLTEINGVAFYTAAFDHLDRKVSEAYFDEDATPTVRSATGAAEVLWEYDTRGNNTFVRHLDENGRPVLSNSRGYSFVQKSYDSRDRLIEEAYFSSTGKREIDRSSGASILKMEYSSSGEIDSTLLMNENEELIALRFTGAEMDIVEAQELREFGKAKSMTIELADKARELETSQFGEAGISTAEYLGFAASFAIRSKAYDEAGELASEALTLNPDDLWLQAQLAHSLLFQHRYEEAEKLYSSNKGKIVPGQGNWEEFILREFYEFEGLDLDRNSIERIRVYLTS